MPSTFNANSAKKNPTGSHRRGWHVPRENANQNL
jgi:hypothetical protein